MSYFCYTTLANNYLPFFTEDKASFERALEKMSGQVGQHYCLAIFKDKKRGDAYVEGVNSFFIDVDVPDNYDTIEEALSEWKAGLERMGCPEPTKIVSSGTGLHLYWDFKEPVGSVDWNTLRDAFVSQARKNDLRADFQHTKPSSCMRVIGSVNEKSNTIVTIIGGTRKPIKLIDISLNMMDSIAENQDDIAIMENKYTRNGRLPDFEIIKSKCETMAFMAADENQPNLSEVDWRALLSIVKRCEGGEKLIHDVSRNHPEYDFAKTVAKADKTLGPYSCEAIKNDCPNNRCAFCKNLIKNPILLGYNSIIDSKINTDEEQLERKELLIRQGESVQIGRFEVNKEGIFAPDKDGEIEQITAIPIYVGDIIENTIGDAVSGCYLKWVNSNGKPRNEFIDYATLSTQKDCIKWLADRNLMNKMFKLPQFVTYIYAATSVLEKDNLKSGCARYGWAGEDLIMPYGKVTQYGVEDAYIIGNNVSRDVIKPTGENTGLLKELFEYLVQKNNGILVAPMMMSIAAPLFPKFNQNPFVFYLSGQSGSGKSTVGFASMALYGFRDKFNFVSGETTLNSITDKMSSLNCLTLTLDEVSLKRRNDMREIIMQAVNGRPKGRLTKSAQQNTKEAWWTPLFITSNPSYSEGNKEIDNAQGVRMVEFSLWEPLKIPVDFIQRLQKGLVNDGMRIAQYIVKNREYLITVANKVLNRITSDNRYDPSMRFLAGSWAVMMTSLEILKNVAPDVLPLIDEDRINKLERMIIWEKVPVASSDVITKAINDWINNNNDVIAVWLNKACLNDDKLKRAWARYEKSDRIMFLSRKVVKEILCDCAESTAAFEAWCKEKGVQLMRVRLMPKSNPTECYAYYMGHDSNEPTRAEYDEEDIDDIMELK